MKNNSMYLPAYSLTGLSALEQGSKKFNSEETFRFYNKNENPCFEHKGLLISAGHAYKKMDLKEKMNFDFDQAILLGDSGGYQIATGQIDPKSDYLEKIFNWLENNTNYALNIDIPMYINKEGGVTSTLEEKLKISKNNYQYFYNKQSGKTKYLNVLHGRTPADLELWYNEVCKDFDFDGGWGIGSANIDIFYILQSIFFLFKKEVFIKSRQQKLLHILGISNPTNMIILEYIQKKFNEYGYNYQITFDSSTPDISAGMGNYILFIDFNKITYLSISSNYKNMNISANLPCFCPVCSEVKFSDFYQEDKKGFKTLSYNHISFHNLYQMLEYKKKVDAIINMNDKELYSNTFSKKIIYIFKIIDLLFSDIKNYNILLAEKFNIMSDRKSNYDFNLNKKRLF